MDFQPYAGNGKPFVYAMYAHADKDAAEAVLSALREKGYELYPSERFERFRIGKAALVLFFLSPAAAVNEAVNRAIGDVVQRDGAMLAIHLSPTALTPVQRLLLNSQQAILRYDSASDEAFYDCLYNALPLQSLQVTPAQKHAANLTTWGISAGVLLTVALAVFFTLHAGGTIATDSILADLGYGGKTSEISEIWVYGDTAMEQCCEIVYPCTFMNENGQWPGLTINNGTDSCELGTINSIADFSQLKNLEKLSLAGNQISDFSSLYGLKQLTYLDLTANPVSDISNIGKMSALETLLIDYTDVSDFSPLQSCKNLKTVYLDEAQYSIAKEQLGTTSFALVVVGPQEEINSLMCSIYAGTEEYDNASPNHYGVWVQSKARNIYELYAFQILENGVPLGIEQSTFIDSDEDGRSDEAHLNIDPADMSLYDPNAQYTLIVTYGSSRAVYQIWHKYDAASPFANEGNLIERAN